LKTRLGIERAYASGYQDEPVTNRKWFVAGFFCGKGESMSETLREFCDSRGVRVSVDRERGWIGGVKILGMESRNGRRYSPEALERAAALYEGAKVNVNHPKGQNGTGRDYQDRLGSMRNVQWRSGEGLFGDLQFNPHHALAEQLIWDAEHAPENVGFSHNVQARTKRRGEQMLVEEILRVQSVDLVADPATTQGLFEEAQVGDLESTERLRDVTVEQLREARPDLVEEVVRNLSEELRRVRDELERVTLRERLTERQEQARRILREYRLPEGAMGEGAIVSTRFWEELMRAENEGAMRELVRERATLVSRFGVRGGAGHPVSREQRLSEEGRETIRDVKDWVRAIR
jgi:hypothetical protein